MTVEALGDIQYDHLCLKLGLDSTVFGKWVPINHLHPERHRVTTIEAGRGPYRDKEQRDRLRDIVTLQIALTVLKRPKANSKEGSEEQAGARDRARRKTQSWILVRSLDMIASEVINPVVSHLFPDSSMELLTQLYLLSSTLSHLLSSTLSRRGSLTNLGRGRREGARRKQSN